MGGQKWALPISLLTGVTSLEQSFMKAAVKYLRTNGDHCIENRHPHLSCFSKIGKSNGGEGQ